MSAFSETEAEAQGLWEHLTQLTENASERIDRLLLGDEAYEYSQQVSAEVRRIEHQRDLERMHSILRLSRRNRGEE